MEKLQQRVNIKIYLILYTYIGSLIIASFFPILFNYEADSSERFLNVDFQFLICIIIYINKRGFVQLCTYVVSLG